MRRRFRTFPDQPFEEIRFGRADRKIAAIVQHEDLDRKLVMPDGLQFLDVELDAAIARQADHALPIARKRRPDGGRQIMAHRCRPELENSRCPLRMRAVWKVTYAAVASPQRPRHRPPSLRQEGSDEAIRD